MTTKNAAMAFAAVAVTPATIAGGLHLIAARLRYEAARDAENAASQRLPDEIPLVQITTGRPGKPPRYAYSEDDIEASLYGRFRDWSPGFMRDLIESRYHQLISELRAKEAEYHRECEVCGYAAAERELIAAAEALTYHRFI